MSQQGPRLRRTGAMPGKQNMGIRTAASPEKTFYDKFSRRTNKSTKTLKQMRAASPELNNYYSSLKKQRSFGTQALNFFKQRAGVLTNTQKQGFAKANEILKKYETLMDDKGSKLPTRRARRALTPEQEQEAARRELEAAEAEEAGSKPPPRPPAPYGTTGTKPVTPPRPSNAALRIAGVTASESESEGPVPPPRPAKRFLSGATGNESATKTPPPVAPRRQSLKLGPSLGAQVAAQNRAFMTAKQREAAALATVRSQQAELEERRRFAAFTQPTANTRGNPNMFNMVPVGESNS